jgi:hypothetical protein
VDLLLTAATLDSAGRLRAVRAWWRAVRPGPSLGHRLDLLYTTALSAGILGALAYGTASSALAQVVGPAWLAHVGPALALVAVLLTARWGGYQGPVVFSVADVTHLLGAPLPRRGLAGGRLARSLAAGAGAGALVAGALVVGLAGEGRGIAVGRAAGLVAGVAELGVLGVAAAWAVECSARWDRLTRRAIWPAVAVGAGLWALSGAGAGGRAVALWGGPWGWALQPGTTQPGAAWAAALALLTVLTAAAAALALRGAGNGHAERHLSRAEARANALASLMSFDARTARLALETAGAGGATRGGRGLRRLRRTVAARGRRTGATWAAIVWRDAVAVLRTPGRAAEGAVLAAGGVALAVTNGDRVLTAAAAMALVYAGAARLLWPLRAELDRPARARILLRPRLGRIVAAHLVVPVVLVVVSAAIGALGAAAAGGLPSRRGAVAALAAIAVTPVVTFCAAMSARRGGRLSESVFATAVGTDPSGGGFLVLGWLALWPGLGAALGAVPVIAAVKATSGDAVVLVLAVEVAAAAALLGTLRDDPPDA